MSFGKFVPTRVTASNLPQYPFINGELVLIIDTGQIAYGTGIGAGQYMFIAGGSGESNTASNVGGGAAGTFQAKVGLDLQFRTFTSVDASVTITENAQTIDLSAPTPVFGSWQDYGEKTGTESNATTTDDTYYTYTVPGTISGTTHLVILSYTYNPINSNGDAIVRLERNSVQIGEEDVVRIQNATNASRIKSTEIFQINVASGDTFEFIHRAGQGGQTSQMHRAAIQVVTVA